MCDVTRTQHNIGPLASLPGSQGSVDITKNFQGIEGRSYLSNYRTTTVWGAEKKCDIPEFSKDSAHRENCLTASRIYDCKHKSLHLTSKLSSDIICSS